MFHTKIMSKILICEENDDSLVRIKDFCELNNLYPLKMADVGSLEKVLSSHLDLGGVFLSENFSQFDDVIQQFHHVRAEVPIFVLRTCNEHLSSTLADGVSGEFTFDTLEELKALIEETIFSMVYPEKLITRMREISMSMLESQFKNTKINCDLPYLVLDHMIFGKLLSIIPIESDWCRGYMSLQAEKAPVNEMIKAGKTHILMDEFDDGFRGVSSLVGELTNLIWGGMKNEFFNTISNSSFRTQVPILINHDLQHISFGSKCPQLCFRYELQSENIPPIAIYQKFIFNLEWSPERFVESDEAEEELVESGGLELF
ncbi:MAG: chemotaxis protein CheX [Methylococcales bacterium]|jgi:hypothetical protein|nr:chemotaxis protein CheX [Methylococcales bacterium]MBT7445172.1 chemotaxis protein CheX [Methylococcales bacterium]